MQQQQRSHTSQGVSYSNTPAFSSLTDPSKPQHQQENDNRQTLEEGKVNKQKAELYHVTVQPTSPNNLDSYSETLSTNPTTKKKKKRRRRCCRRSKQSDREYCDDCDTWLCNVSCDADCCSNCGGCGSCGD